MSAPQRESNVLQFPGTDAVSVHTLRQCVELALQRYFADLDGHPPAAMYRMVLREIEPPLLEAVLRYTKGNQTRAAAVLGLNRGTLRKKLKQYGID